MTCLLFLLTIICSILILKYHLYLEEMRANTKLCSYVKNTFMPFNSYSKMTVQATRYCNS